MSFQSSNADGKRRGSYIICWSFPFCVQTLTQYETLCVMFSILLIFLFLLSLTRTCGSTNGLTVFDGFLLKL